MAETFQLPLAFWKVQYDLLGGRRRMLMVLLVYGLLLIVGSIVLRRIALQEDITIVTGWLLIGLAVLQGIILVPGGCNAVHRAMLRDFQTKMIESHRLTPMANLSVALGYLLGATLQVHGLFAVNTLFGMALSWLGEYPIADWLLGNAVLASGAVMLWSTVVFSGMCLAKPLSPAPILILVGLVGNVGLFVFPGAGLLFGVYSVAVGYTLLTAGASVPAAAVGILLIVNLILTSFWLSGAAVKYRRPDLPALNATRGLAFLVLWLVTATGGLVAFEWISRTSMPGLSEPDFVGPQWCATMIASLLVALVAVNGAVQCRLLVARGASPRGWSDRVPSVLVAVLAPVLICGGMCLIGHSLTVGMAPADLEPGQIGRWLGRSWIWSLLACLLAILTIRGLMVWLYSSISWGQVAVALFVIVAWGAPPTADFAMTEAAYSRPSFSNRGHQAPITNTWLFGCSPVGTIIAVWTNLLTTNEVRNGLIVQTGVVALVTIVAAATSRKRNTADRHVPQADLAPNS